VKVGNIEMGSNEAIVALGLQPDTVLDIGACEGESIERFRVLWPGAFIHSFEPRLAALPKLYEVAEHAGRCHVYPTALGDRVGTATMHEFLGADGAGGRGSSSLLGPTENLITSRQWARRSRQIAIFVGRLDDVIDLRSARVIFAKIDVQGYEAEVIRGGPETFGRVAACQVEVGHEDLYAGQASFEEVDGLLRDAGLGYVGTSREVRRGGKLSWADHIWRR
jgi:FkbM family methyltransferase